MEQKGSHDLGSIPGKEGLLRSGKEVPGALGAGGKGGGLAIAQTPSLEVLLLQALGPFPWAHTRRADLGTSVTPEGYT